MVPSVRWWYSRRSDGAVFPALSLAKIGARLKLAGKSPDAENRPGGDSKQKPPKYGCRH